MNVSIENNFFLISNSKKLSNFSKNFIYLFGYCFTENSIIKNREITIEEYNFIEKNRNLISGIFFMVKENNDKINVIIDPLIQYNLYYYQNENEITISNSIFKIAKLHRLKDENECYIKDIIRAGNPMYGNTIIKDVFFFFYSDMYNPKYSKQFKKLLPMEFNNFTFLRNKKITYNDLDYDQLIDIYIQGLKNRAKIISNNFEEVYISLTGGTDSRLVAAAMLNYPNVYHYCFGDGYLQDRLVSEYLINNFNLKTKKNIPVIGNKCNTVNDIIQCIEDTSCQKPYLDFYINGKINKNICKLSGYYGEIFNLQYSPNGKIQMNYILIQLMSHFGCNSIVDNLYSNNFDLLIDPIYSEIVRKCPYDYEDILKKVILVDIIYKFNKELALAPYDKRTIPKYRDFSYIPSLNCFKWYRFPEKSNLKKYNFIRPTKENRIYGLFQNEYEDNLNKILYSKELKPYRKKYQYLLNSKDKISDYQIVFYLCSIYYLHALFYLKEL